MDAPITWLARLRWGIAAGQLALVGLVAAGIAPHWPISPILALAVVGALSNLALRPGASERVLAGIVALDTALLTGLLLATGGTSSPMSTLYLVPVTAAAFTLRPALVWLAVAASGLAYAALFAFGPPPPHHHDHTEMQAHVFGMFGAFAFTAPLLGLAVSRVRHAQQDATRRVARSESLAALATLAAGAAHELANPLSTIMLVARELENGADARTREDLELIREEVLRCQEVLHQLSADAGAGTAEPSELVRVDALVDEVLAHGARLEPVTVALEVPGTLEVRVARRLIAQALRTLLGNAREASGPDLPIRLRVRRSGSWIELAVEDDGPGMDAATCEHAVEPFFTTKADRGNTGLGLYFASAVAHQHDGELELTSVLGRGTTATLRLPA